MAQDLKRIGHLLEETRGYLGDERWESGECATFAVGLQAALKEISIESSFCVGLRTVYVDAQFCRRCKGCPECRVKKESAVTWFSHVVVDVDGVDFDYCGLGASDRWQERFEEFFQDEEIRGNKPDSFEFEWRTVTLEELTELCRVHHSTLDLGEAEKVRQALADVLKPQAA